VNEEYGRLWSWIMDGAPENRRLELGRQVLRVVRPGEHRRFYQGQRAPLMRLAGLLGTDPRHQPVPELSDRRLFVKTVYVPLAVEWLVAKFEVDVFVLLRHPGNVLASWISLDLTDRLARLEENPAVMDQLEELRIAPPKPDPLERLVWQIGVLTLALEQAAARHPSWVVRTHEELCIEPTMQFQQLYSELGLTWSERAEQYLAKNNRPGEGFPTQRVASDQPDAWKSRLTSDQIEVMERVLSQFPLATWKPEDFIP
jgi:hypothetical protein